MISMNLAHRVTFLLSEERTSSTHALTMYRHNTVHNDKAIKVGKAQTQITGA